MDAGDHSNTFIRKDALICVLSRCPILDCLKINITILIGKESPNSSGGLIC